MNSFIGNASVVSKINSIISNHNIGHAYLFAGPEGIGKSILANDFASQLLTGTKENHNSLINNPDLILVEPIDDLIKVDEIRKVSENIVLKPISSERKVCIINDADNMNEPAQNALLKILEEPPSYATIIMITSNKEKILNTIKSRCTILNFDRLTDDELREIFKDEELNEELISYSSGSASKYLKLKNSDYIDSLLIIERVLNSKDLLTINQAFANLRQVKTIKDDILDILDLLIIKLGNNLLEEPETRIAKLEAIEEVRSNLSRNANFDTSLDYLLIRIWEINNGQM